MAYARHRLGDGHHRPRAQVFADVNSGAAEYQTEIESQQAPAPLSFQGLQPDIGQFGHIRRQMRLHPPHPQPSWEALVDPNIPKVRMANRSQVIVNANTPQLVIPQNDARSYFIIANMTGATIKLSFGFPIFGVGIPIQNNSLFQMAGTAVSVDDLWVTTTAGNAVICAFEGAATFVKPTSVRIVR